MNVVWERPGDEQLYWKRMGCGRLRPMLVALHRIEFDAFARGFAMYGNPGVPPRMLEVGGWLYKHQGKADPAAVAAWEANLPEPLARAAAQPLAYWETEMLPSVRAALERLEAVPLESLGLAELRQCLQAAIALDEQVELLIQPMMVIGGVKRRFLSRYGGEPDLRVEESIVQRMDRALRQVRETGELGAFLQEFGDQLQSRDITQPTWREEPEAVLRLAAGLKASAPAVAPAGATPEYRAAREAAVVEEEHSVWLHLRARAPLRAVLLAFGRRLSAEGAINQAEDIWWVTPEELMAPDNCGLRPLVTRRRADWDRLAAIEPPVALGVN